MINDVRLFAILIVINIVDMGVTYLVIFNLLTPRPNFLNKEDKTKHPPITIKMITIGLVYSIVVSYFGYFFIDSLIFRATGIMGYIGLIKYFTKNTIANATMIYALTFLVVNALQVPIIVLQSFIQLPIVQISFIAQVYSLLVTYFLNQKFGLHKAFVFIKRNLQTFNVFILTSTGILTSFTGFYLTWNSYYLAFVLGIILTITVISLYQCIIYVMRLQLKLHNMSNLLEGIEYLLKTEENKDEIYQHYEETLKNNDFNISKYEVYEVGKYQENLIEFINAKKGNHKSKAEINTDIKFYYRNNTVPIPVMIQMLGTLLDNALETKTKKPIFVDMTVVGSQLEITVSNASDYKSPVEIDYMFGEGSSKKKGAHGYGLPSLLKSVKSYGGVIIANCDYNKTYKSHYLTLTLKFIN